MGWCGVRRVRCHMLRVKCGVPGAGAHVAAFWVRTRVAFFEACGMPVGRIAVVRKEDFYVGD